MKVALISPNPAHLQEIARMLGSGNTVLKFDGGKSRVREIAEQDSPDLMVVDGICRDPQELSQVEWVTSHHPETTVILTCASHTPEFLLAAMRAGVREVLPSPAPEDTLRAAVDRVAATKKRKSGHRGRTLAFMSCKGGSGSTFLATNLGWQLAQSGEVLLLDLNLQFGDALAFVCDGRSHATISDVARDISRLDAALLAACTVKPAPQYSLLAAPEDLALATEIRPDHVQSIIDTAIANYDFVLLDLPRSLDPMTINALDRAERIFCVLQPSLPDLRNASRLIKAFHALGYTDDKLEIVLNRHEKSAEISADQVRRAVGGVRLHTVPNAWREVSTSINHGDPLSKSPRGPVSRQLSELARLVAPQSDESQPGLLGRLFRRA